MLVCRYPQAFRCKLPHKAKPLSSTVTCRGLPRDHTSKCQQTNKPRTLYGLLGIKRSAGLVDIRTAYRNAARRLHPDTNASPAAVDDFQRIKAAYEVLSDSRLRRLYDNLGFGALGAKYSELAQYLGASGEENAGLNRRGGSGMRGRDVHTVLGLLLSEAAQGAEKLLSYEAPAAW
ncbi:hypothetical protein Agub_g691 [Astrephomene gubernaculifera]|uniref:J domain-containing protein n=1 Tax=Astrephomene gubernaculifera TaxID=47775 RepID=A0AAD3DE67_9CHLO|nr:hypothetical protein Agub_g691 [Astrephomene gubernaculifera]